MKLGVSFGHSLNPIEMVVGATSCERFGFEALFVSESTGIDALSVLGAIAAKTSRIEIGSGVVNVYSRSPTQLAMAASTLSELSGGRFVLGIGSSSKAVISGWHGLEYTNQLRTVSDSIDSIRKRFGEANSKLRGKSPEKITILLAAVGQKMISLACSKADGLIFFLRPLNQIRKDALGIDASAFRLCASVATCVSDQAEAAKRRVRRTIAFYIAFGEAYRKLLVSGGDGLLTKEVSASIRNEWMRGKSEASAALVPLDLLEQLAIFGTPAECKRKVEEYRSIHAISMLLLQFNAGSENLAESFSLLGKLADEAIVK
ncbi:MAG: LLM class flavin-dependent oxidoreductase [Nitrososphaerales archaeon]